MEGTAEDRAGDADGALLLESGEGPPGAAMEESAAGDPPGAAVDAGEPLVSGGELLLDGGQGPVLTAGEGPLLDAPLLDAGEGPLLDAGEGPLLAGEGPLLGADEGPVLASEGPLLDAGEGPLLDAGEGPPPAAEGSPPPAVGAPLPASGEGPAASSWVDAAQAPGWVGAAPEALPPEDLGPILASAGEDEEEEPVAPYAEEEAELSDDAWHTELELAMREMRRSSMSSGRLPRSTQIIPVPVASDDPLVGRVVEGKYRVLEPIGSGGMASVYRAWHLMLDRVVALKFILPEAIDSPQFRERFFREARISSELAHPHLVATREFGETAEGEFYMVMDYVEGQPLDRLLQAGPLAPERAARIGAQLLEGLGAVHAKQIVHRDLKPGNVLVDAHDHARLFDFGLAKRLGPSEQAKSEHLTDTGAILGTPRYMAPEQASGAPCDPRADLYAVGLILIEMIRGDLPFVTGSCSEVMRARVSQDLPAVGELCPGLNPRLVEVIGRALTREPAGRFQAAREFRDALLGALSQPEAPDEPVPPRSSSPLLAGLALAALGIGLTAAVVLGRGEPPAPPAPSPLGVGPVESPSARPSASPSGAASPEAPAEVSTADVVRARVEALDAGALEAASSELEQAEAFWRAQGDGAGPEARREARERFRQAGELAAGRRRLAELQAKLASSRERAQRLEQEALAHLADVLLPEPWEAARLALAQGEARSEGAQAPPEQLGRDDLPVVLEAAELGQLGWEEAATRLQGLVQEAAAADPAAGLEAARAEALASGAETLAADELRELDQRRAEALSARGEDGLMARQAVLEEYRALVPLVGARRSQADAAGRIAAARAELARLEEQGRRSLVDVHLPDRWRAGLAERQRLEATEAGAELAARVEAYEQLVATLRAVVTEAEDINAVRDLLNRLAAALVRRDKAAAQQLFQSPDELRFLDGMFQRGERIRFRAGAPVLHGEAGEAPLTEFSYQDQGKRVSLEGVRADLIKVEGQWKVARLRRGS